MLQITTFIIYHNYHNRYPDATLNYFSIETPADYTDTLEKKCGESALRTRRFSVHFSQLGNVILSGPLLPINLSKPTGLVKHQQFNIQQLYVLPTLYLCFVFIWEQTATCATCSINWLGFITEMKNVYCSVQTGSLNKAVCASHLTF